MNKKEFEKVFTAAAEKSGVAGMARDYQFAENLQAMMIDLRDKLYPTKQPSEDLEGFDGLEDSIIEFLGHVPENEPEHSETLYTYEQMQEIACHFAKWQKEQFVNKSCQWLKDNLMDFLSITINDREALDVDYSELMYAFKKTMEDEQ